MKTGHTDIPIELSRDVTAIARHEILFINSDTREVSIRLSASPASADSTETTLLLETSHALRGLRKWDASELHYVADASSTIASTNPYSKASRSSMAAESQALQALISGEAWEGQGWLRIANASGSANVAHDPALRGLHERGVVLRSTEECLSGQEKWCIAGAASQRVEGAMFATRRW